MIDRNKFKTDIGKKLYDMLVQISDNEHFLVGVFLDLKGDEKKKKMIKLLENGLIEQDEIVINAMAIDRNITPEEIKDMYDLW